MYVAIIRQSTGRIPSSLNLNVTYICRDLKVDQAVFHLIPTLLFVFRIHESPPFTNTGVDFTCPLFVKNGSGPQMKVWIALL